MTDATTPSPATSDLGSAADRLRETAKWLVATIGAVGAVVVASVNFTDIGGLIDHGSTARIVVGLGGLTVATAGFIWMLMAVVSLATAGTVQLVELQQAEAAPDIDDATLRAALEVLRKQRPDLHTALDYIDRHPDQLKTLIGRAADNPELAQALSQLEQTLAAVRSIAPVDRPQNSDAGLQEAVRVVREPANGILGGFASVDELAATYADALSERHAAFNAYWNDPEGPGLEDAASFANNKYLTIDADVGATTTVASYLRLQSAFRQAQGKVIGGFVIIVVGIASFVGATTVPKAQASLTLIPKPITATLSPTPATRAILQDRAGRGCGASPVQVVVVGKDHGNRDIVVPKQPGCHLARLTVTARELQ